VNFGLRWEPECLRELEAIYGDVQTADAAIASIDWQLARNPLMFTWELHPGSDIRLARVLPYLEHPAVYLSFRMVSDPPNRYCLIEHARRANVASSS